MNNILNISLFTLFLLTFDGYGQDNARIHDIPIDSTLLSEADYVADVHVYNALGNRVQEGGSNWTIFKFETVNQIKKISTKRGLEKLSDFNPPTVFSGLHGDDSLFTMTYFDSQALKKKVFKRKCCDTLKIDYYYRVYLKFGREHTPGEFENTNDNNLILPTLILLKAVPIGKSYPGHIMSEKEKEIIENDTIIDFFPWEESNVKKDPASAMCQMLITNDINSIELKIINAIHEINLIGGENRLSLLRNWLHTQPCIVAINGEEILTSFPGSTGITIRVKTNNKIFNLRLSLICGKRERLEKKKYLEDYDYIELESISVINFDD